MNLRIKRVHLPDGSRYDGPEPLIATAQSAGADFYAASKSYFRAQGGQLVPIPHYEVREYDLIRYGSGFALEIPQGYFGLVLPRSSSIKYPIALANSAGVIDADFRGELSWYYRVLNASNVDALTPQVGERIGQLLILPHVQVAIWDVGAAPLSDTARGEGGYGSTGTR